MTLYNEENKKVEIGTKIIGGGHCSEVHEFNERICAKVYYDSCLIKNRIEEDIYKDLKTVKTDYLVRIYQLLYKDPSCKTVADGYLMKQYTANLLEILGKEVEFTLYMMEQHLKLFDQLADKHIIVDDLKLENMIYTDEKLVLLDPDLFYYRKDFDVKSCRLVNYHELVSFYKKIYEEEIIKCKFLDRFKREIVLNELFDFKEDCQLVKRLSDNFKGYKYPIDYVLSKKNRIGYRFI